MIDNIVENAYDRTGDSLKVPINFSVTCSEDNRVYRGNSLDNHLEMVGMAYRLVTATGDDMIDDAETQQLYLHTFRFRGISDGTIYKDENTARLTNNYGAGFLYSAELMRKNGDKQGALALARKATQVLPHQWQNWAYLSQMYAELDQLDSAEAVLHEAPDSIDLSQPWGTLAHEYWQNGDKARAYAVLNKVLDKSRDDKNSYQQLLSYFYRDTLYDSLQDLLQRWIEWHPSDTEAQEALFEAQALAGGDSSGLGVRVRQVDTVHSDTTH